MDESLGTALQGFDTEDTRVYGVTNGRNVTRDTRSESKAGIGGIRASLKRPAAIGVRAGRAGCAACAPPADRIIISAVPLLTNNNL